MNRQTALIHKISVICIGFFLYTERFPSSTSDSFGQVLKHIKKLVESVLQGL